MEINKNEARGNLAPEGRLTMTRDDLVFWGVVALTVLSLILGA